MRSLSCLQSSFATVACLAALAWLGPLAPAYSQDKPAEGQPAAKSEPTKPEPSKSLDDDLLEQLTEGLDLGPATKPGTQPPVPPKANPEQPATKPAAEPDETPPGKMPAVPGGDNEPGIDPEAVGSGGQTSPLEQIGKQMREVQKRLQSADAGTSTQTTQTEIVQQLTQMLQLKQAQAQKNSQKAPMNQQQQAKREKPPVPQAGPPMGSQPMGPAENPSDKPSAESTDRVGQDEVKKHDPFQQLTNFLEAEWGNLPERDRNMVLQAFREKFLPQYDGQIRAYYDELSRSARE